VRLRTHTRCSRAECCTWWGLRLLTTTYTRPSHCRHHHRPERCRNTPIENGQFTAAPIYVFCAGFGLTAEKRSMFGRGGRELGYCRMNIKNCDPQPNSNTHPSGYTYKTRPGTYCDAGLCVSSCFGGHSASIFLHGPPTVAQLQRKHSKTLEEKNQGLTRHPRPTPAAASLAIGLQV
jgi:hypothetical protein